MKTVSEATSRGNVISTVCEELRGASSGWPKPIPAIPVYTAKSASHRMLLS
jgi:hypothetical protein